MFGHKIEKKYREISENECIRWFHQSRIISFSTAQTEKNIWEKFVKQIGENI